MCSLLKKEWFLTSCYSSHTHILHIIDIIVCDIYICVLDIQSMYIFMYIHLYSKCIYIYHNVGNFLTAKGREFSQELELKEVQTDAPRQEWPTHLSDPRMSWGNSLPFQPWWVTVGTLKASFFLEIGEIGENSITILLGKQMSVFSFVVLFKGLKIILQGTHSGYRYQCSGDQKKWNPNLGITSSCVSYFVGKRSPPSWRWLFLWDHGGRKDIVNAFCMMDFGAFYALRNFWYYCWHLTTLRCFLDSQNSQLCHMQHLWRLFYLDPFRGWSVFFRLFWRQQFSHFGQLFSKHSCRLTGVWFCWPGDSMWSPLCKHLASASDSLQLCHMLTAFLLSNFFLLLFVQ